MTEIRNSKPVYDLEERAFQFAKAVRLFVKTFLGHRVLLLVNWVLASLVI
jgi:hypothetical protein